MRNCVTVSVFTGAIGFTVSFFFLTGLSMIFFTAIKTLLGSRIATFHIATVATRNLYAVLIS